MYKLRFNGDMVMGLPLVVDPSYQPKENEIVVENIPQLDLQEGQRAYLYWRKGQIEYELKESNYGN